MSEGNQSLPKTLPSLFNYDFPEKFEILMEGSPEKLAELRSILEFNLHLNFKSSTIQVDQVSTNSIPETHAASSIGTGEIEISPPPSHEPIIRDVTAWNNGGGEPLFLRDIYQGDIHFIPTHTTFSLQALFEYIYNASRFDLNIEERDLDILKNSFANLDLNPSLFSAEEIVALSKEVQSMIRDSANLEKLYELFNSTGLKPKLLKLFSGEENTTVTALLERTPLKSFSVVKGQGKTLSDLKLGTGASHSTSDYSAYQSLIRGGSRVNAFISRSGVSGESADGGNGFYVGMKGGYMTEGFFVPTTINPEARVNLDFTQNLGTPHWLSIQNKNILTLMPMRIINAERYNMRDLLQLNNGKIPAYGKNYGDLFLIGEEFSARLRAHPENYDEWKKDFFELFNYSYDSPIARSIAIEVLCSYNCEDFSHTFMQKVAAGELNTSRINFMVTLFRDHPNRNFSGSFKLMSKLDAFDVSTKLNYLTGKDVMQVANEFGRLSTSHPDLKANILAWVKKHESEIDICNWARSSSAILEYSGINDSKALLKSWAQLMSLLAAVPELGDEVYERIILQYLSIANLKNFISSSEPALTILYRDYFFKNRIIKSTALLKKIIIPMLAQDKSRYAYFQMRLLADLSSATQNYLSTEDRQSFLTGLFLEANFMTDDFKTLDSRFLSEKNNFTPLSESDLSTLRQTIEKLDVQSCENRMAGT